MWACIFDEGEKKGLQKKKVEAPSIRLGDFTMALGWLRMRSPPRRLQGPGNLGSQHTWLCLLGSFCRAIQLANWRAWGAHAPFPTIHKIISAEAAGGGDGGVCSPRTYGKTLYPRTQQLCSGDLCIITMPILCL